MPNKGRSKTQLKYIQDEKKRADALYKRRRGLMKKAHELSVICGVKISVIGTDFNKTCFSYSNDDRFSELLDQVLRVIYKPIWLTKFDGTQYPFESNKEVNKHKVLFGRKIQNIEARSINRKLKLLELETKGPAFDVGLRKEIEADVKDFNSKQKNEADILGKRYLKQGQQDDSNLSPSLDVDLEMTKRRRRKILKVLTPEQKTKSREENLEDSQISSQIYQNDRYFKFNPKFGEMGEITSDTVESYLALSLREAIESIKKDPTRLKGYLEADPCFFQKLEKFKVEVIERMITGSEKTPMLPIILRNFICLYFSTKRVEPFCQIKSIPPKEIFSLLTNLDTVEISRVIEIFLRVIFGKIKPTKKFRILEVINSVEDFSKLRSFKSIHVKKMMLGRISLGRSCKPLSQNPQRQSLRQKRKKGQQTLQEKMGDQSERSGFALTPQMRVHFRCRFIAGHDNWMILTLNEIIGINLLNQWQIKVRNKMTEFEKRAFAEHLREKTMNQSFEPLRRLLANQKPLDDNRGRFFRNDFSPSAIFSGTTEMNRGSSPRSRGGRFGRGGFLGQDVSQDDQRSRFSAGDGTFFLNFLDDGTNSMASSLFEFEV